MSDDGGGKFHLSAVIQPQQACPELQLAVQSTVICLLRNHEAAGLATCYCHDFMVGMMALKDQDEAHLQWA